MKIEVGGVYTSAHKCKVEVVYKKSSGNYLAVYTFPDGSQAEKIYTESGKCRGLNTCNIVSKWVEPIVVEGWVNVFSNNNSIGYHFGVVHPSESSAKGFKWGDAYIKTIHIKETIQE